MFWADRIVDDIETQLKSCIENGEKLVIRDEKTASGRVHVGSMRGVALHSIISEILSERGVLDEFLYEFNDMDPMDGLPTNLLNPEEYRQYLGKPLRMIPSPRIAERRLLVGYQKEGYHIGRQAKNFAEYFAEEFIDVIEGSGFRPIFYRVSELYLSGAMNDCIRVALTKAATIRHIYKDVSGSEKPDDWLPLNVICESCGKVGTTQVTGFDGEKVSYVCKKGLVEWAAGCEHSGTVSPFDGNATLPFKVEWPAKWKVKGVHIEGAGKDHSTKGGARDVADHIARDVFDYEPPFNIPYEFFLVGGKKMSSSKGAGSSAREVADLLPPHIFRLALLGKDPNQQANFEPDGDTIPVLFDRYDAIAKKYFDKTEDDNARLFELVHAPDERPHLVDVFRPRFREVAFLVQMPHLALEEEAARMKGSILSAADKTELAMRARYARVWLLTSAPPDFKYELATSAVPTVARNFSPLQKDALTKLLDYVSHEQTLDGQALHTALHNIRKETGIEPAAFFSALYLSFLGRDHGPKAGWFLSILPKDFLEQRLREVAR